MTATVLTARALLLDMDGTLVNSDAVVERIWRRWSERHGLDGDEVMKVVHGRQGHASMAMLLPDSPASPSKASSWSKAVAGLAGQSKKRVKQRRSLQSMFHPPPPSQSGFSGRSPRI